MGRANYEGMYTGAQYPELVLYAAPQAELVGNVDSCEWAELVTALRYEHRCAVELARTLQSLAARTSPLRPNPQIGLYEHGVVVALSNTLQATRMVSEVTGHIGTILGMGSSTSVKRLLMLAPPRYCNAMLMLQRESEPYLQIIELMQIRLEDRKHLSDTWARLADIYFANGTRAGLAQKTSRLVHIFM